MTQFEIRSQFYLDGQPFKILSGAIQYFRLHPDQWGRHSTISRHFSYTVETYLSLGICHEPHEGSLKTRACWISKPTLT